MLAVHTWNVADKLPGGAGLRLHGHAMPLRAGRFALERGLLRLVDHADGRATALGGYVSVLGGHVSVGPAAGTLWRWEVLPGGGRLRVAAGVGCGAALALEASEERDERSVYAVLRRLGG